MKHEILIVDDAPENLQYLSKLLLNKDYKVRALPNGKLALKSVEIHKPDLILLDIFMPGMDGFQVCKKLKEDDALKDIPVIFLSVSDDQDNIIKAFEVGGVDYISKPFHPMEVYKRIQTHLAIKEKELQMQELLSETLIGSLYGILDIMALTNPAVYGRANRMNRMMRKLTKKLKLSHAWCYEAGALLYDLSKFNSSKEDDLTSKVLSHIPRMEEVSLLLSHETIDDESIKRGRVYLKILSALDDYEHQKRSLMTVKEMLYEDFNEHHEIVDILIAFREEELKLNHEDYRVSELISGIIVVQDVYSKGKVKLVGIGTELTTSLIEVLRRYHHSDGIKEPIKATKNKV